ncbi:AAA-ATPase [Camellia lanceoleosa]|uniref:AAA-ATPase n=1 Tax=Camellia lanceoleosa TaxID=1840588 RepID=A0ACC0IUD9_9ERIC|nr:AAA-ATPase [Camellia lanceoleosa]
MEFNHPVSLDTIATEESKKYDIIDDLRSFFELRDYYRRIGKPWKRGYLLHGPPGTGKSTMIAAMANELNYDVYDLEFTVVTSNANLKKLLNRTPCNSILVIEDIDCLSDISSLREKKQSDDKDKENVKFEKVTLSALLNCIDGLFLANEGGRVMEHTRTNMLWFYEYGSRSNIGTNMYGSIISIQEPESTLAPTYPAYQNQMTVEPAYHQQNR